MVFSPAGQMVFEELINLGNYHDRISVDEFVRLTIYYKINDNQDRSFSAKNSLF